MLKNRIYFIATFLLFLFISNGTIAQELKLQLSPQRATINALQVPDISGNGYKAHLKNGAKVVSFEGEKVMELGSDNGYIDLGPITGELIDQLSDFTIYTRVFIPSSTNINGNGNFVWNFANSDDIVSEAKGCMFLSAKNTRYAISPTNWTKESGVESGNALPKGEWFSLTYSENSGTGTIYINGIFVASGPLRTSLSSLGATTNNFLGRSSYKGDAYLKNARYSDFRIYKGALSEEAIFEIDGKRTTSSETQLLVDFDFESNIDNISSLKGAPNNGAKLVAMGENKVLDLGEEEGYFDLGKSVGKVMAELDSFSVSTNLMIPLSSNTGSNGNFIWTFANSNNMSSAANGNLFMTAASSRFAISPDHWRNEETVNARKATPKGKWINITYTQLNKKGYIYINGQLTASGSVGHTPKNIGTTAYNYLGRSCYNGDSYLKGALYSSFRIYNGAIGKAEIMENSKELPALNQFSDKLFVENAQKALTLKGADAVRSKINLPKSIGDGVNINWESSNTKAVANDGTVYRPAFGSKAIDVELTATLTYNQCKTTKSLSVKVLPQFSNEKSVDIDLANLSIKGNKSNARHQLQLPIVSIEGCTIQWSSSDNSYINALGKVLQLSPMGKGKKEVTLTATVSKGDISKTKSFTVFVAEYEDKTAYLFSYFTGNAQSQEQIRFALSYDGYNYIPLNNGEPIIRSEDIANKKAVRDPHILRGHDGKTFYMVVTDMKSSQGWSSNRGMVLLKSTDLVNWTHSAIHFPDRWPEKWGNVLRVWAPQTIYDPQAGKYMVYFSQLTNDGKVPYDKVFYCYANEDFTDFEGEPTYLFDRGSATIDGDIIYNEADNLYHMFFKNEGLGGICKVTSPTLTAPKGQPDGSQWSLPSDNLEQTDEAVEGAGVFRLINTNQYVLMYDCYGAGHYQFCTSDNLNDFTFVKDNHSMNARHGTTIAITAEEAERLVKAFPSPIFKEQTIGARNTNIRTNGVVVDQTAKTITIRTNGAANQSTFNPYFYGTPGTQISPKGEQDFSNGPVKYTFKLNSTTESYQVTVEKAVNPVLPGFRADPDVLYSEKTGLFYIYPTSDGFPGWGGYYFDVFSSPDLVNWTNEGTFLDLSTDQVSWASGNAWAPCIAEKKMEDGSYRYYFYFSGNAGNRKKIGVAVADHPTGPFVDSGSPMINQNPGGVGGQIIDGDVFSDPQTGKNYFYWGNGYFAVAELNEDMISIKEESEKIITPKGGTLETYAYREAPTVFYRNGLYYFLWSVDDTGSPNYHVAYGTATSPTGPIEVAKEPIVIIQDAENEIYGSAHNSVVQLPGTDEWYIVYHRINKDYLSNGPGYHREVCIDKMTFDKNGKIERIIPTHEGIEPVK